VVKVVLNLYGNPQMQAHGVPRRVWVRSCVVPISTVARASITTIEGLSVDRSHPLQRAWIAEQVPQCGYCQSGVLMVAAALLPDNPRPSEQDINSTMTNLCRCGTYPRVKRAILRASNQAGSAA
jgi:isoquinoline 1-oxidoreductase alpha subunit